LALRAFFVLSVILLLTSALLSFYCDNIMREYTKQEIAKAINRSVRNIKYWTDQDIVKPEGRPARGRGHVRTYSAKNLIEFAMVDYMSGELGVPLQNIKSALHYGLSKERILDPQIGVEYEVFWGFAKDHSSVGLFSDSRRTIVYEHELHAEKSFPIRPEEPWDELAEWLANTDVEAFTVLRLGEIRNKALRKHSIDLGDIH
jgi:DNA-binding transcriptional MerR regulator